MPKVNGPTYAERIFAREYVNNNGNASDAFRKAYPRQLRTLTPSGLSSNAQKVLRQPRVQDEIHKLEWAKSFSREDIVSMAYKGYELSVQKQNTAGIAQNARLLADLGGFIVQKHEDLTSQKRSSEEMASKAQKAARSTLSRLSVTPEGIRPEEPEAQPAETDQVPTSDSKAGRYITGVMSTDKETGIDQGAQAQRGEMDMENDPR